AATGALDLLMAGGVAEDLGGAVAGCGVGVDRVGVLLDDLSGHRIDEPAIAVEDGDDDGVAAGGALALLGAHAFGCFQAAGAGPAVESVALPAAARLERRPGG